MQNPFRCFNSSPEVIRLAVMMYIRKSDLQMRRRFFGAAAFVCAVVMSDLGHEQKCR